MHLFANCDTIRIEESLMELNKLSGDGEPGIPESDLSILTELCMLDVELAVRLGKLDMHGQHSTSEAIEDPAKQLMAHVTPAVEGYPEFL